MSKGKWVGISALIAAVIVILTATIWAMARSSDDASSSQQTGPAAADVEGTSPSSDPVDGQRVADPTGRMVVEVDSPAGAPVDQSGQPGGFPDGNADVGPPEGLTLQRIASGATVAVSKSDGPTAVEGDIMTGYSQSARGAALTATDYAGRIFAKGQSARQFLEHYAPDAFDGDAARQGLEEIARGNTERVRENVRAGYAAPRWYRFRHCAPEFCTVELAHPSVEQMIGDTEQVDTDGHPVIRVSLRWADDRWQFADVVEHSVAAIDPSWEDWA